MLLFLSPSWHLSLISFSKLCSEFKIPKRFYETGAKGLDFAHLTFGGKCSVPDMQLNVTK